MSGNERPGQEVGGRRKKRLSPEDEIWHRIAQDTGRTVNEAKQSVTAGEFLRWSAFYQKSWETQDRYVYQMALIAYQCYLLMFVLGGTPTKKIEDFVLEFVPGDKSKTEKHFEVTAGDLEKETEQSKSRFAGFMAGLAQAEADDKELARLREAARALAKTNPPPKVQ